MLCVAVGPGGGLLKICMLIFQALPKCTHISFFGRAYVMYKPELGLVHEILPNWAWSTSTFIDGACQVLFHL